MFPLFPSHAEQRHYSDEDERRKEGGRGLMALEKKRRRKEEVKVEGEARKEGNGRNNRFEEDASERKQR